MMLRYLNVLKSTIRVSWILITIPVFASCTSYEVEDHSFQFNQAVGSLGNRLLLLNAVRAAKGYPMQFSKLQAYTGQGRADGSVALDLPFFIDTLGQGTLSPTRLIGSAKPSAALKTGVNALQLVDLNTAEAQGALRKQASAKDLEYYMLQAWPPRLVLTIMLEGVEFPEVFAVAIAKNYQERCRMRQHEPACKIHSCFRGPVGSSSGVTRFTRHGVTYIAFENDPRVLCKHVMFQWIWDAIDLAGGGFDLPARKKMSKKNDGKAQKSVYRSDRFAIDVNVKLPDKEPSDGMADASLDLFFEDAKLENLYQRMLMTKDDKGNKIDALEIPFRSPERMVRYLGDIIAVQELAREGHEIRIRVGSQTFNCSASNAGLVHLAMRRYR